MNEFSVAPGIIFRNISALNANDNNNQQMQNTYVHNVYHYGHMYVCMHNPNVFIHTYICA